MLGGQHHYQDQGTEHLNGKACRVPNLDRPRSEVLVPRTCSKPAVATFEVVIPFSSSSAGHRCDVRGSAGPYGAHAVALQRWGRTIDIETRAVAVDAEPHQVIIRSRIPGTLPDLRQTLA